MNLKLQKDRLLSFAPLAGLLLLAAVYYFVMEGDISPYNMKVILNQVVIIAIVATGATFIFSIGAFDISLGASTAVSAMCGAVAINYTGSAAVMFVVCVLVGVLIGVFNSTLAAVFNLPAFVTTIAMLSVLTSLVEVILAGQAKLVVDANLVASLDTVPVKVVLLVGFVAICAFVFLFTPIGRQNKFLGANPVCAKQTGISAKKLSILAFSMAGIGVGIGAFLTIVRAPVLSKGTASSIGMDVLIAIVFGGMPLSGGARSKIFAAVVGATSIVLLNQILPSFGFSSGVTQIIKAALFLIVVFCAGLSYREQMLPR